MNNWKSRAKKHFWRPLKRAYYSQESLDRMMKQCVTPEQMATAVSVAREEVYRNHLYTVTKRVMKPDPPSEVIPDLICLSIKRNDKEVIKDWRHFQFIKNELCGEESLAIEFYPPESKLVDSANQYFLYVFPDDSIFPFIFQERIVTESSPPNGKQRPFEIKPTDLISEEEMYERIDRANLRPAMDNLT